MKMKKTEETLVDLENFLYKTKNGNFFFVDKNGEVVVWISSEEEEFSFFGERPFYYDLSGMIDAKCPDGTWKLLAKKTTL